MIFTPNRISAIVSLHLAGAWEVLKSITPPHIGHFVQAQSYQS